jgi:hypothetical protein
MSLAAAPVHAIDRHWSGGSGLWTAPSEWSPGGVPQPADSAIVDHFAAGVPGSVRIHTNTVPAVTAVTIANANSVSMYDGRSGGVGSLLVGTDFIVGNASTAGALNVMRPVGSSSFPGGLTVLGNLRLGVLSGGGVVNQNAGTVTIGDAVILGDSNLPGSEFNAAGVYNLSGGRLRAPFMILGYNASTTGTFNLSGSGVAIIDEVYVGANSGSTGTVRQTGGNLVISGQLFIGTSVGGGGGDSYHLNGGNLSSDFTVLNYGSTINYTSGSAYLGDLWLDATNIGTQGARVTLGPGGDNWLRSFRVHIEDAAVIDLNDNRMTIGLHGASISRDFIRQGYNGGSWTGDGITSSVAAAVAASGSPHRTGLGYNHNVIQYTFTGDADLDGDVDLEDIGEWSINFTGELGGDGPKYWFEGDWDYDGDVDLDDVRHWSTNFTGELGAGLTLALDSPVHPQAASALAAMGIAVVPEPATLSALIAPIPGLLRPSRACRRRVPRYCSLSI